MKKVSFRIVSVVFLALFGSDFFLYAQEENFVYDDQGKRDPFWRLVTPSGVIVNYDSDLLITDLTLEGIIYEPRGSSYAIINGKIVGKGGSIGLFTVLKIGREKVILVKGQYRFELKLKQGGLK